METKARYIIIAETPEGDLIPIVQSVDYGLLATFDTREEAFDAAMDTGICQAYSFEIINFDEAMSV